MTDRDFAMEAAEALAEEGLIEQYQGADDEREAIENSRRRERAIRIIRPIIEQAQAAAKPVEVVGGDEELVGQIFAYIRSYGTHTENVSKMVAAYREACEKAEKVRLLAVWAASGKCPKCGGCVMAM